MSSLVRQSWMVLLIGILGLSTSSALAQQYIYTNDNVANSTNSTTALTCQRKGRSQDTEDLLDRREECGQRLLCCLDRDLWQNQAWETVCSFPMAETAPLRPFR